jgi:uncharacterized membrane protein YhaH (DUF805 family)
MHLLTGPLSRTEFFVGFIILLFAVNLFLSLDTFSFFGLMAIEYQLLSLAGIGIFAVLAQASILFRRLDDLGHKQLFILLYLLPPLYIVALPFLLFKSGGTGVLGFSAKRFFGLETSVAAKKFSPVLTPTFEPSLPTAQSVPADQESRVTTKWEQIGIVFIVITILLVPAFLVYLAIQNQSGVQSTDTVQQMELSVTESDSSTQPESSPEKQLAPGDVVDGFTFMGESSITTRTVEWLYLPTPETRFYTTDVQIEYSENDAQYHLYVISDVLLPTLFAGLPTKFELLVDSSATEVGTIQALSPEQIDLLCGYDCTTVEYGDRMFESIDVFDEQKLTVSAQIAIGLISLRYADTSRLSVQNSIIINEIEAR